MLNQRWSNGRLVVNFHKWEIVLKEKVPAKILLSSNISLARAVQEIIGPQLFLYGPSAVTLGQYSPVRPPRSVGKKSVFKAFEWHFILRDFISKAIYLAKLKQNYDRILHHTAIFFNWIILRKKEKEGVKDKRKSVRYCYFETVWIDFSKCFSM